MNFKAKTKGGAGDMLQMMHLANIQNQQQTVMTGIMHQRGDATRPRDPPLAPGPPARGDETG